MEGQEHPSKKRKRSFEWKDAYAQELGVSVNDVDMLSGKVLTINCKFCQTFGRSGRSTAENTAAVGAAPTADASSHTRGRSTTSNIKWWREPFRKDNIKKHMVNQHPEDWERYCLLLRKSQRLHGLLNFQEASSTLLKEIDCFFKQKRMLFSRNYPVGSVTSYIHKDIVERIIMKLLVDPIATETAKKNKIKSLFIKERDYIRSIRQTGQLSNSASCADESPLERCEFDRYVLVFNNMKQTRFCQRLLGSGLSFSQCAKAIQSAMEELGAYSKVGNMSRENVSDLARMTCAMSLEIIRQCMKGAWAYSIVVDMSTDSFGVALLDMYVYLLMNNCMFFM